ncbi:hypothetical protein [Desertibaculum subflavum]|uniref:hypothetical protein n=1 Tax=Desertibaculum subflavum TaxID=2268458 RepID=UPI000E66030D
MSDPFRVHDYHDQVRARIAAAEPGYAQSVIDDVMVSFEAASFRGPVYAYDPLAFGMTPRLSAMLDQMIVDVAHGEAIASPQTFSRARIERLVADLRSFPATYLKQHRRAALLHDFYLADAAPGASLTF